MPFTFHFASLYQKYQKYYLSSLSDLTFVSDREGIDNPFIALVARLLFVVLVRGTRARSPTGLIPWFSKTEGNTYATLLHHPLLFGEIQRSAQEVARRIFGVVAGESAQKSTYQVPITIPIDRITLFAICLSFSSPPLHPCRFIRPLFPNLLLSFPFAFFPLPFCLLVC